MRGNFDGLLTLVAIGCLLALLVFFAGLYSAVALASVSDVQDVAVEQGRELLNMIGPHGLYAILGAIFVFRVIRVGFYLDKQESIIGGCLTSAVIGSLTTYFYVDGATVKEIAGGAVMTIIGTIVVYEASKAVLALLYGWLGWSVFIHLYYFLCPRPVKVKREGKEIKVQNHGLTEFFDRARLDKEEDS